jgi:hypothetical protein
VAGVLGVAALAVLVLVIVLRQPVAEYRARRREREQERKRQWRRDKEAARLQRRQERAMNPARAAARKGPPTWQQVEQRQGGKCWLCGKRTFPDDRRRTPAGSEQFGATYPSVDYVVPLESGGTYQVANARVAHRHCQALRRADGGRREYGAPQRTFPPTAK